MEASKTNFCTTSYTAYTALLSINHFHYTIQSFLQFISEANPKPILISERELSVKARAR